ncbi:MAG: FtsX-like permease family protein [Dehalococcoidia bacterium]|nr:MAG: FtsX-like permease family protein [Dehalococcoidia bacterium]
MKKWLEPFGTAWVGVSTHKLRSFLTVLGIVIGVSAVISLMSIGKGTQRDILSRLSSLGSDLISISPGASFTSGGVRGSVGSAQTLTQEDAAAIAQGVSFINLVSPTYSTRLQLVAGGENTNATVTGVSTDYLEVMRLKIASGAFFTDYEYQRGAKVLVLGSGVKETLFGDSDAIGQQVRIGNSVGFVIGVLESKGTGFGSPDEAVLLPLTAMQQIVSRTRTTQGEYVVSTIVLTVSDEKKIDNVISEITSLLRTRHRLAASASNDFTITSALELTQTVTEASGTLTLLLGAIAAISLLVGGIGVMNIMLVSVLERTREIGIRKAMGARERDIWLQFLMEAAFLTLAGGIIGVIAGWLISYFVSRTGIVSAAVTPDIVILAVSVSVGIGLFFGFYPAWNASRLNPIEALRSE